jgi:hypothetical protein
LGDDPVDPSLDLHQAGADQDVDRLRDAAPGDPTAEIHGEVHQHGAEPFDDALRGG